MKVPDRQWSRSCPSEAELTEFFEELSKRKVSPETFDVMRSLASCRPDIRLAINLKVFLKLTITGEVTNILNEGLTRRERAALIELDMGNFSIPMREIAHGLLNVHERWMLLKSLSAAFRQAKRCPKDYLDPHLLGNILGKEE